MKPLTLWQHTNGGIYEVLMITNLEDTEKYPKTVVYQNVDNKKLYSRKASDWNRSFKVK